MTFNHKYSVDISTLRQAQDRLSSMRTVILNKIVIFIALLVSLLFSSQATAQTSTPLTATRASSFTYNLQGLLLSETIEPDSPQSCLVTTYGYDSYGNKLDSA